MEPRNSEGSAGDMGDVAGRSCLGLFQQEMERWMRFHWSRVSEDKTDI